jgi:hypothetical protein
MHPENDTLAAMKDALVRMCEDFGRATEQAKQLRDVMERMPMEHARRATEQLGGTSYVQVLQRTIVALDEMRGAYQALRTTIVRRAAGLSADASADGSTPTSK